jgi:penicillin amidase
VDTVLRRKLDFGPVPRGGYGLTPGATGMADNQTVGASFRFITDLSDWDKAVMINTPGQSGDPASPFYGNLFRDWANDRYFPALFTREMILSHLHGQTKLLPAVSPANQ